MSFLKMKETFEIKAAIAGAPLFSLRIHLWKFTLLEEHGKMCQKSHPLFFSTLQICQRLTIWGAFVHEKWLSLHCSSELQCIFPSPSPQPQGSPNTTAALQLWYLWEPVTQEPLEETVWNLELPHSPSTENFHYLAWKTTGKLHSQD